MGEWAWYDTQCLQDSVCGRGSFVEPHPLEEPADDAKYYWCGSGAIGAALALVANLDDEPSTNPAPSSTSSTTSSTLTSTASPTTKATSPHWEYYERGGWKPTSGFVNRFLEEQIEWDCVDSCGMNIDATGNAKYEWNFKDLLQKRKWQQDDGQWVTVKTRSIRRVVVLAAPEHPVG